MDDRQFRREVKDAAFAVGVLLLILATYIILTELGILSDAPIPFGTGSDRPPGA